VFIIKSGVKIAVFDIKYGFCVLFICMSAQNSVSLQQI